MSTTQAKIQDRLQQPGVPATESTSADFDATATNLLARMRQLAPEDPERSRLRDQVIEGCLPLARRTALRFANRGEELEDLIQVALLAAIKAVDRFDAERGESFLHYVVPTMVGELKRHFRDRGWMIRVRRQLQELHMEISRTIPTLSQTLRRVPTVADLAEHLKVSTDQVSAGLECARAYRAYSLNAPVRGGADVDVELGDMVGGVDRALELVPERQALWQAVSGLPAREQKILILRFFGNMTQSEIARNVGVSQMHVSRLLTQSLNKLRMTLVEEV
jgi:RNA polymerase sigma-B factor